MSKAVSGLYAVTPELADTAVLSRKVEAALRGGARIVQYRNKTATTAQRRFQLDDLVPACRRAGACLIINDSVELAREFDADGVHLGREDATVDEARRLLGPDKLIGVSCYDELGRASAAVEQGADYIAFGSFFPSATKPNAVRAPLELLQAARKRFSLPIVAIGGVTVDNAGMLIEAGADAIAVVTALFDASDIEREARRLSGLFVVPGLKLSI